MECRVFLESKNHNNNKYLRTSNTGHNIKFSIIFYSFTASYQFIPTHAFTQRQRVSQSMGPKKNGETHKNRADYLKYQILIFFQTK